MLGRGRKLVMACAFRLHLATKSQWGRERQILVSQWKKKVGLGVPCIGEIPHTKTAEPSLFVSSEYFEYNKYLNSDQSDK